VTLSPPAVEVCELDNGLCQARWVTYRYCVRLLTCGTTRMGSNVKGPRARGSLIAAEGLAQKLIARAQDLRRKGLKQRIAYRQSVLGEGRSRMADPLLYGRSAPLMVGIVDEFPRYRIAVRHQALQHHGQVHVRNRPIAE
jgi:hypothetical protein